MDGDSGLHHFSLEEKEVTQIVDEKIDYFNIANDAIYYSTSTAEVDRSLYKVNKNGEQKQNLEVVIYSINIFDDFVVREYGRQGFVQYTLIDRKTGEITDIVPVS